jgi:hypothetical protein
VDVRADWTGFEIPDEFVVGYGIDLRAAQPQPALISARSGHVWDNLPDVLEKWSAFGAAAEGLAAVAADGQEAMAAQIRPHFRGLQRLS